MDRALRRFYAQRWKNRIRNRIKVRYGYGYYPQGIPYEEITPAQVGKEAKCRKFCSWYCCGSRRRYEGISRQETKQIADFHDQLDDLTNKD